MIIKSSSSSSKSLKYCENYQNVTQRQEVSKCRWKNGADRRSTRVATDLQFVKNTVSVDRNKVKHNKMRYVHTLSIITQSWKVNIIIIIKLQKRKADAKSFMNYQQLQRGK